MVPTLKFRWLVLKNKTTADAIAAVRDTNGVSFSAAKASLERATPPELQQWWAPEGGSTDPLLWDCGEWRTIETVIEPHPTT